MPVTMPGRAMGSTSKSDTTSWPKKRLRAMAPAARVPSTMAARVASPATSSDSWMARHTSGLFSVTSNHFRVSPGGGNW
ncbi:hypothetical protein D3C84_506170 [compost metagenome]